MKTGPTKQELFRMHKIQNAIWIGLGLVGIGILFFLYLFARPIILEEHCMPKAREAAKKYSDFLVEPPQDLIDAYKNNPDIIDKDSQPSPYYVELLRCELQLSKRLYPFLHL